MGATRLTVAQSRARYRRWTRAIIKRAPGKVAAVAAERERNKRPRDSRGRFVAVSILRAVEAVADELDGTVATEHPETGVAYVATLPTSNALDVINALLSAETLIPKPRRRTHITAEIITYDSEGEEINTYWVSLSHGVSALVAWTQTWTKLRKLLAMYFSLDVTMLAVHQWVK